MTRVAHYYPDLQASGGIPSDARALLAAQSDLGEQTLVFCMESPGERPAIDAEVHVERRSVLGLARIVHALRAAGPDVVHVWGALLPGNEMVLRSAHRAGIPTLVSPHSHLDTPQFEWRRKWFKRTYRRVAIRPSLRRWTDVLHALTEDELDTARQQGFPGAGVIFPFGIPTDVPPVHRPGPIRLEFGLGSDQILIGFFGRVEPHQKGLDLCIEGFARARHLAEGGEVTFVIAGKGSSREWSSVRELVARHGLDGLVRLCGPYLGDDRFEALRDIDLLLHTSRFDGLTRVIRESAAVGTPIVITPAVHAHDIVAAGGGWMVRGAAELADCISASVRRPKSLEIASRSVREWGRRHTWADCAADFHHAYRLAYEHKVNPNGFGGVASEK